MPLKSGSKENIFPDSIPKSKVNGKRLIKRETQNLKINKHARLKPFHI